jgi:polyisoprenoid-binding protein YceI
MTTISIPTGYIAGTWDIDPIHSEVSFQIRHLVVSKVRGRFDAFEGTIVTAEDPAQSSVRVTIDTSSIDTNNADRDTHVRSADFLDTESFPQMSFSSTGVRVGDGDYLVDGELTIHGVTKPVTLGVEVNGFTPDHLGGTRAGFSAVTEINRGDFGISFNGPIPGTDGVMLSDKISITLEIQAVLQRDHSSTL